MHYFRMNKYVEIFNNKKENLVRKIKRRNVLDVIVYMQNNKKLGDFYGFYFFDLRECKSEKFAGKILRSKDKFNISKKYFFGKKLKPAEYAFELRNFTDEDLKKVANKIASDYNTPIIKDVCNNIRVIDKHDEVFETEV